MENKNNTKNINGNTADNSPKQNDVKQETAKGNANKRGRSKKNRKRNKAINRNIREKQQQQKNNKDFIKSKNEKEEVKPEVIEEAKQEEKEDTKEKATKKVEKENKQEAKEEQKKEEKKEDKEDKVELKEEVEEKEDKEDKEEVEKKDKEDKEEPKGNPQKAVEKKEEKPDKKEKKISSVKKAKGKLGKYFVTTKEKEEKLEKLKEEKENKKKEGFFHSMGKATLMVPKGVYRVLVTILKAIKIILNIILIGGLVAAVVGCILWAKFRPLYEEASKQAYEKLVHLDANNFHMLSNTVVYDKDDNKIGEINSGSYKYVKIANISEYLQEGYIATEDKRFYEHGGVDLQSMLRAAVSLVAHNGEITQGGSTITQQIIKNNLLSQEQSYSRKLTEVFLAPELEKKFNKAEIMEFYCNSNYYGNHCYGVENAAEFYFGVSAKDVTLAQAAMICGISNSPNNYNPINSMKLAKQKQRQVLDNMLSEGYITKKQYKKAKKEKIKLVADKDQSSSENYMVSYAVDCATLQLMKDNGFEFKYTFTDSKDEASYKQKYQKTYRKYAAEIRAGGYKLYTSFDQKIQKKLQKSVSSNLSVFSGKNKKTKKYLLQGAAMCIDNDSQYVVAVVGGRNKSDPYNRAFLSYRQPGSSIKPLLDYGPAVDNGIINGSSIFEDRKVYWDESNKKSYSPKNSGGGYRGRVSIREALGRSINTVAFEVFKKTGVETATSYLDALHFGSISYADTQVPAIALGGFTYGASVNDMCRGYATLENNGKLSSRTCIRKLTHETKGTVYNAPELEDSETEVYSADTSFIMKDIMQGTFNEGYGTGHKAFNSEQIYAGKTGTTSFNKDAWFCGFSAYYTTAVWIGYDTPKVMPGMYGGTYPLRIWSTFMNSVHKNKEKRNFELPKTTVLRHVSGGKLIGKNKEIEYDEEKNYYNQRPSGYDYYSTQNTGRKTNWKKNYELESTKRQAEQALSAFEKYKITNVKKAKNFQSEYDRVIGTISQVPDEYEQSTLKQRAVKKYNSLNSDVISKWKKAIDEEKAAEKARLSIQQKVDAENSRIKAQEYEKKKRITKAEWYISKLNSLKYYTKNVKKLIDAGGKAMKKISKYPVNDTMKAKWKAAVKRAKKLPNKPKYEKQTTNNNTPQKPSPTTAPDMPPVELPTEPPNAVG